ncbi:hypothetical protein CTI12_AA217860 [Artemisia annua]|uniref:Uncharacterized protein n=1 Tax=Artemisia annua TaxID=35608 RepID=A0A2U1NW57_ARTAN|nr:hypothetical protein CTI12_AA217860 [Artemisia annua]
MVMVPWWSPFFFLESDVKERGFNGGSFRIYGVGVDPAEVETVANATNCVKDKLPFVYLGLPVGSNMRRLKDKYMSLLGKWKWRFCDEDDALWQKVIKEIYGPHGGLNQTTLQCILEFGRVS